MRIHRLAAVLGKNVEVVNCFQNTNFSEDSQDYILDNLPFEGCELLSEY